MDPNGLAKTCNLGDQSTSDVIVRLRNHEGRTECFYSHSSILATKSRVFADQLLSSPKSSPYIEIQCSEFDYNHHIKLLRLFYLPVDSVLDSVKSAIDILHLATAFCCEDITRSCIQYLEAVPWEGEEEEEILKAVTDLGPVAMPILARIEPVNFNATKDVLISAFNFATSNGGPCPPFGDELKTSAQEQVEFMLGGDEDIPLVRADAEVKSAVKIGLSKVFSSFEEEMSSLLVNSNLNAEIAEEKVLQCLSDMDWMCNILPKIELMKDFVSSWAEISCKVLVIVEDRKLDHLLWGLKLKLLELTGKSLDAVGYGSVILPAQCRVHLVKTWLPFIRKMKPLLDAKANEDAGFPHKMDDDLCQSIEGAIVSLILALPSNDQAEILADWMNTKQVKYPDLTEAFEVWCYRTKSAKRRLAEAEGLDRTGDDAATITL